MFILSLNPGSACFTSFNLQDNSVRIRIVDLVFTNGEDGHLKRSSDLPEFTRLPKWLPQNLNLVLWVAKPMLFTSC